MPRSPQGEPEFVDVHDLPTDAVGKAIPYGVYDLAANDGFVSVGVDHDTPTFASISIDACKPRYPNAREIFITADAGGSNGHRRPPPTFLEGDFPPGTSKWNKVAHRLLSFTSINWRGRTYETVINLIGKTTNRGGLVVRARLDRRRYPTGKKVSAKEFRVLNTERDPFHGAWNYVVRPRTKPA